MVIKVDLSLGSQRLNMSLLEIVIKSASAYKAEVTL